MRFGGAATTAQRKAVQRQPVINALTATPSNRDVRVHDSVKKTDAITAFYKEVDGEDRCYFSDGQVLEITDKRVYGNQSPKDFCASLDSSDEVVIRKGIQGSLRGFKFLN